MVPADTGCPGKEVAKRLCLSVCLFVCLYVASDRSYNKMKVVLGNLSVVVAVSDYSTPLRVGDLPA